MNDYSQYTFEDFLQDDFFISSMREPTVKSLLFWREFENSRATNLMEFKQARSFIESIITQESPVEDDRSVLWKKINDTNHQNRWKKQRKRVLYIGLGAAASLLLFLFIPDLFKTTQSFPTGNKDIMAFVQENQWLMADEQEDVQLVLSDEKTIQVNEKESTISYDDSAGIKVSKQEIPKEESASFNQLIVPKGKRSKLVLSDGTQLYVNSGTQVIYPIEFTSNQREIYVNGEVFIEVIPDKNKPFIVKTNDLDISVLGTRFNVMAYNAEEKEQVVLASGKVNISRRDQSTPGVILSPSEMYQYNLGVQSIEKVSIEQYTSWINGTYYFERETLEKISQYISRYYGASVYCSKDIAELKCSGKIDINKPVDVVLDYLAFVLPVSVVKTAKGYEIKQSIKL